MSGYKPFPVKYSASSNVVRQLFIKVHLSKELVSKKPDGRTLVVLNVPPLVTEACLKNLFGNYGPVDKVIFQSEVSDCLPKHEDSKFFLSPSQPSPESYSVAYLVFKNEKSLKDIMTTIPEEPLILFPRKVEGCKLVAGVKLWAKQYNDSLIDPKALQQEVDDYMAVHDKIVEDEKQREKEAENVPDEDGWVKVTKHGKRKLNQNSDVIDAAILSQAEKKRVKREKAMKSMAHFYTHTGREGKLNKLSELKVKFEEDKKRIATLKSQRKFKP
ncbi:Ribosomal RNA-processing protein 7 -like protein A [Halotydeus destructor]|nr:Ribosomal RNA-processing protein 7 -like protein A [Halotydeus destructor]